MKDLARFSKNKKILVTGATGFKGAWLCSWLIKLGANVYGVGFSPNKNKNFFYSLSLNKKIVLLAYILIPISLNGVLTSYSDKAYSTLYANDLLLAGNKYHKKIHDDEILKYNEIDCKTMMEIIVYLRTLIVKDPNLGLKTKKQEL